MTIPNGISFSLDDSIMYWTDTPTGNIYAFDYDMATGNISNQRVFWHADVGFPDGHAMDAEGNLWVAMWGGWKVLRVSPEGKVTGEIEVPTRCPTVRSFFFFCFFFSFCYRSYCVLLSWALTRFPGRYFRGRRRLYHERTRSRSSQISRISEMAWKRIQMSRWRQG